MNVPSYELPANARRGMVRLEAAAAPASMSRPGTKREQSIAQ
jgi:hypothetical protein